MSSHQKGLGSHIDHCYKLNCVPDKIHMLIPNSQCGVFQRWGLWGVIRIKWVHEHKRGSHEGISALVRRHTRKSNSLSSWTTHLDDVMWAQRENEAICKPGTESSSKLNHCGTWILEFQPLELWENKFIFSSCPAIVFRYGHPSGP